MLSFLELFYAMYALRDVTLRDVSCLHYVIVCIPEMKRPLVSEDLALQLWSGLTLEAGVGHSTLCCAL